MDSLIVSSVRPTIAVWSLVGVWRLKFWTLIEWQFTCRISLICSAHNYFAFVLQKYRYVWMCIFIDLWLPALASAISRLVFLFPGWVLIRWSCPFVCSCVCLCVCVSFSVYCLVVSVPVNAPVGCKAGLFHYDWFREVSAWIGWFAICFIVPLVCVPLACGWGSGSSKQVGAFVVCFVGLSRILTFLAEFQYFRFLEIRHFNISKGDPMFLVGGDVCSTYGCNSYC